MMKLFRKNRLRLKGVNYFRKKAQSQVFYKDANKPEIDTT